MMNQWLDKGDYIGILIMCGGEVRECKIDKEDFDKVNSFSGTWFGWKGLAKTYYVCIKVKENGKWTHKRMHRVVLDVTGDIDHKFHDGLDNRKEMLREVTKAENNLNRTKRADNKSGVIGVNWSVKEGKWRAQIQRKGIKKHIGFYDDLDLAIEARKKAEATYG